MSFLKGLDLWQKISIDNISKPTIIGSLLSISAILITVILTLTEIYDLLTPKIKHDTIIYNDPNQENKIKVQIHMSFPKIPCHLLSVDQEDQMGNHRLNIRDTIIKDRGGLYAVGWQYKQSARSKVNNPLKESEEVTLDSTIQAIKDKESCSLRGYVPIKKVPGDIHISFHDYQDNFYSIKEDSPDLFSKISLGHRINYLFFGEEDIDIELLNRFELDQAAFVRIHYGVGFAQDIVMTNYDYYIKLIPYLLKDEMRGKEYLIYQYSVTSKSKIVDKDSEEMPVIMLIYDMSPLTMRVTRSSKSWTHSLTHICAIVGGVFVMFNLMNKILTSIFSSNN